jgi:protein transport protein SEC20
MQSELSRSTFAQETLEQSNAALADLGEKYTDLNSLLANSKNLVSTLLKSQKSDTWYLETTLYILITTVIWLIFRRWLYGPITWFIWWPLKLVFKVLFAVVPSVGAASSQSSVATQQRPSTSLIVKPSATGGIPKRPVSPDGQAPYVRVGGGGKGYNPDPSRPGSLSQQVGQMAEQNQQQVPDHPQFRKPQQSEEQDGPVVRGDGTVLQESDRPRNPKKKMWDENVESAKHEQAQAKQAQQQEQPEASGHRKRDEL